jgi:hypothetical protein
MLNIYPYKSRRTFASVRRGGGINVDRTYVVKTEAIGKSPSEESPYLLANEWISSSIAQFLRLPVPPFALVRKKSKKTGMFISYSFDGDSTPDDAEPQPLYDAFPNECTGVVVLDILTANCDRNSGNIKVDKPSAPKAFYVFDHERSLFYVHAKDGASHLKSREDRLGVTDGHDSVDEWHCLVELVDNVEFMHDWVVKVQSLPDWFIDDVCEEMWKVSITRPECDDVKAFLKRRRDKIGRLILKNKQRFPKISNWPLFLGAK